LKRGQATGQIKQRPTIYWSLDKEVEVTLYMHLCMRKCTLKRRVQRNRLHGFLFDQTYYSTVFSWGRYCRNSYICM